MPSQSTDQTIAEKDRSEDGQQMNVDDEGESHSHIMERRAAPALSLSWPRYVFNVGAPTDFVQN